MVSRTPSSATGCWHPVVISWSIGAAVSGTSESGRSRPTLGADEERDREIQRSALIPIWSRTLAERKATLASWAGEIVPFVALDPDASPMLTDELNAQLGRGVATSHDGGATMLSSPFCLALSAHGSDQLGPAVEAAFKAFRGGSAGEVVVVHEDIEILRVVAMWAINAMRSRLGLPLDGVRRKDLVTDVVVGAIRTHIGLTVVHQ